MNPLIAEVPTSLIRSISARKQPGDIDLGLGEPTLPPPLDPFRAATEWTARNGSPYSPNAGLPELRTEIAAYVGGYLGRSLEAEHVCVTVGSEEALYLAIKTVIDPARDEVLIVEPCYLAYPKICLLEGIEHRTIALDGDAEFAPDAERVLAAVGERTRLLVLNSPANPTGRVWPVAELERLAAGLRQMGRADVHILSDEVYRELCYEGEAVSPGRWHPNTLVAGSLSKSHSLTGLRLGWLAGPREVIGAATKVHQFINTAASTFSQVVALEIFRSDRMAENREHYRERREILLAAARESGVEMIVPEGAFYALIRLPERWANDTLGAAERLLESRRVVAVPGSAFGESGAGWLRISWVAPDEVLREGIQRISMFFAGD